MTDKQEKERKTKEKMEDEDGNSSCLNPSTEEEVQGAAPGTQTQRLSCCILRQTSITADGQKTRSERKERRSRRGNEGQEVRVPVGMRGNEPLFLQINGRREFRERVICFADTAA